MCINHESTQHLESRQSTLPVGTVQKQTPEPKAALYKFYAIPAELRLSFSPVAIHIPSSPANVDEQFTLLSGVHIMTFIGVLHVSTSVLRGVLYVLSQ